MSTVKTIIVDMTAQTASFKAGAQEVIDGVRNMRNQVDKMGSAAEKGEAFLNLHAAIKGIGMAVNVVSVGTSLWKGNAEDAVEKLEKMPFHIGTIIHEVRELREEWNGVAEATREAEKQVEEMKTRNKLWDSVHKLKVEAQNKINESGLSDEGREKAKLNDELAAKREEFEKLRHAGGNTAAAERLTYEAYTKQWDDITNKFADKRAEKAKQEAQKELELGITTQKQIFDAARKQIDEIETPLDKYGQTLTKLRDASAVGGGSFLDYNKSMSDALKEYRKEEGIKPLPTKGSFMDVTGQDVRAFMGNEDTQKSIATNTKEAADALQQIVNMGSSSMFKA